MQARLIVADAETILEVGGDGEVLEPADGVLAIGSGAPYATAAARALLDVDGLDASTIAHKAMRIAADSDIYTNGNLTVETVKAAAAPAAQEGGGAARILPPEPAQD